MCSQDGIRGMCSTVVVANCQEGDVSDILVQQALATLWPFPRNIAQRLARGGRACTGLAYIGVCQQYGQVWRPGLSVTRES
jgi:hypothetical protein